MEVNATLYGGEGGGAVSTALAAPLVVDTPAGGLDTFQGGLAVNAHGELRFYVRPSSPLLILPESSSSSLPSLESHSFPPAQGPTSSYRSVLADSTSLLNTPATVNAIRAFSLTRAPIPTQVPADPSLPRRPPDLTPDLKIRLFTLAFENCFAHYNIVPEKEFYRDLQMFPYVVLLSSPLFLFLPLFPSRPSSPRRAPHSSSLPFRSQLRTDVLLLPLPHPLHPRRRLSVPRAGRGLASRDLRSYW